MKIQIYLLKKKNDKFKKNILIQKKRYKYC